MSLQGANSEDSANSTNTPGANNHQSGSNTSLHIAGLELGSRPTGYSCSVPATPEHRRYNPSNVDWANTAQHPNLHYQAHGVPPDMYMSMPRIRRGVPYGYPRARAPPPGGRMPVPFRTPQYRSLPPNAYGYYPRGRARPRGAPYHPSRFDSLSTSSRGLSETFMNGSLFRYSSQEDFRGSSRSLAMYPGEYPPGIEIGDPRFTARGRIGGSRESLESQSRESRSLSKSAPAKGQPRSSSVPPAEDRLGAEDEMVLNRLATLSDDHSSNILSSSAHVPSLINSLVI